MRFRIVLALSLMASPALSAQAPGTGVIEGSVLDNAGAPIPNAGIFVIGSHISSLTDSTGRYRLEGVPAGTIDLRAAFVGYRPRLTRAIQVVDGRASVVDHRLDAGPMQNFCTLDFNLRGPILVPRDQNTTRWSVVASAPWWVRPYNL